MFRKNKEKIVKDIIKRCEKHRISIISGMSINLNNSKKKGVISVGNTHGVVHGKYDLTVVNNCNLYGKYNFFTLVKNFFKRK
jgi:hypothetical protein